MAVCGLNEIIISGAEYSDVNGVYVGGGPNVYDNNDTEAMLMHAMGGNYGPGWYISHAAEQRYFAAQAPAGCPTGLTFQRVDGTPGSFVLGSDIDKRNGKYATANESGANRFRRLVALGYV